MSSYMRSCVMMPVIFLNVVFLTYWERLPYIAFQNSLPLRSFTCILSFGKRSRRSIPQSLHTYTFPFSYANPVATFPVNALNLERKPHNLQHLSHNMWRDSYQCISNLTSSSFTSCQCIYPRIWYKHMPLWNFILCIIFKVLYCLLHYHTTKCIKNIFRKQNIFKRSLKFYKVNQSSKFIFCLV